MNFFLKTKMKKNIFFRKKCVMSFDALLVNLPESVTGFFPVMEKDCLKSSGIFF